MSSIKDGGLRIGELAQLAETTPRAIRHYHKLGLLVEPQRDESGYRRYGPQHLVRLVRIRRLRSVGMSLEAIASNLGAEPREADIASALRSLAADIEQQIQGLAKLRARVLDIAAAGSLADPAATWEATLRQHSILDPSAELPPAEQSAAQLIDALHPQGIRGVVDQTTDLLSDADLREQLGSLLRRFQALPDDASDDVIDALAADYVEALPVPTNPPPAIDPEMMEKLLGNRLSAAKLRCAQRVRELVEARRG
jgi:DNA-binding transcriptional MerR regulator